MNIITNILFIFFFTCILSTTSNSLLDVCGFVNCGQGTCKDSTDSIFGFDCKCNYGYKQIQIGTSFTWPTCVLPNCTLDFTCSNSSSPPLVLPSLPWNLSSPCTTVWCGDGSCKTNGTGYSCQCNEGSANLFNSPVLACLKKCYLGADCNGINLVGPNSSAPPPSGSNAAPSSSRTCYIYHAFMILLVVASLRAWI